MVPFLKSHHHYHARSEFQQSTNQLLSAIPSPPPPHSLYTNFLIYSDIQLNDADQRLLLAAAIHGHHSPEQGGRKLLYVHFPEYRQLEIEQPSLESDVNFCVLQQSIRAGCHRCSRIALWIRNTTIERFSSYRSANFGSIHINIPPSVQAFIQLLNEKFLIAASPQAHLKVRCELDDSGVPTWKTEEVLNYGCDIHYTGNLQEHCRGGSISISERPPPVILASQQSDSSGDISQLSSDGAKKSESSIPSRIIVKSQRFLTAGSPIESSTVETSNTEQCLGTNCHEDESFASAIKKKKHAKKSSRKSKSSGTPLKALQLSLPSKGETSFNQLETARDQIFFEERVTDRVTPLPSSTSSSCISPRLVSDYQFRKIPPFSYSSEEGEVVENLHLPPCSSSDADIFEYLRPICPRDTKVDLLVHLHHVCPFRQSYSLILSLIYLRIFNSSYSNNLSTTSSLPTSNPHSLVCSDRFHNDNGSVVCHGPKSTVENASSVTLYSLCDSVTNSRIPSMIPLKLSSAIQNFPFSSNERRSSHHKTDAVFPSVTQSHSSCVTPSLSVLSRQSHPHLDLDDRHLTVVDVAVSSRPTSYSSPSSSHQRALLNQRRNPAVMLSNCPPSASPHFSRSSHEYLPIVSTRFIPNRNSQASQLMSDADSCVSYTPPVQCNSMFRIDSIEASSTNAKHRKNSASLMCGVQHSRHRSSESALYWEPLCNNVDESTTVGEQQVSDRRQLDNRHQSTEIYAQNCDASDSSSITHDSNNSVSCDDPTVALLHSQRSFQSSDDYNVHPENQLVQKEQCSTSKLCRQHRILSSPLPSFSHDESCSAASPPHWSKKQRRGREKDLWSDENKQSVVAIRQRGSNRTLSSVSKDSFIDLQRRAYSDAEYEGNGGVDERTVGKSNNDEVVTKAASSKTQRPSQGAHCFGKASNRRKRRVRLRSFSLVNWEFPVGCLCRSKSRRQCNYNNNHNHWGVSAAYTSDEIRRSFRQLLLPQPVTSLLPSSYHVNGSEISRPLTFHYQSVESNHSPDSEGASAFVQWSPRCCGGTNCRRRLLQAWTGNSPGEKENDHNEDDSHGNRDGSMTGSPLSSSRIQLLSNHQRVALTPRYDMFERGDNEFQLPNEDEALLAKKRTDEQQPIDHSFSDNFENESEDFGSCQQDNDLPKMHPRNVKRRMLLEKVKKQQGSSNINAVSSICSQAFFQRTVTEMKVSDKQGINEAITSDVPSSATSSASDVSSTQLHQQHTTTASSCTDGSLLISDLYSIGDLVEIIDCGGRRDLHEGQRGEILAITVFPVESPTVSSSSLPSGSLVTLHLCRGDGKRTRLKKANAIKENIPVSNIRLLERAADRRVTTPTERKHLDSHIQAITAIDRLFPDVRVRRDIPINAVDFFNSVPGDANYVTSTGGSSFNQLVATPFSLSPPKASNGVLCFFWDLEATGLDVNHDDITQIACVCRRFHFGVDFLTKTESNRSIGGSTTEYGIHGESCIAATSTENNEIPTVLSPSSVDEKGDGEIYCHEVSSSGQSVFDLSKSSSNLVIPFTTNGSWEVVPGYPEAEFNRYVYTDRHVPKPVVELTGITNQFLNEHGVSFYQALDDWKSWIFSTQEAHKDCPIWFVAHNGNRYDLPLLFQQEVAKLGHAPGTFLENVGVVGIVDTVVLSRRLQWGGEAPRRSHKLQTLYYDIFHHHMPNEHDALGDVTGLAALMAQEPFLSAWQNELIGWSLDQYLSEARYLASPHSFGPRVGPAFYTEGPSQAEEDSLATYPATVDASISTSNNERLCQAIEPTTILGDRSLLSTSQAHHHLYEAVNRSYGNRDATHRRTVSDIALSSEFGSLVDIGEVSATEYLPLQSWVGSYQTSKGHDTTVPHESPLYDNHLQNQFGPFESQQVQQYAVPLENVPQPIQKASSSVGRGKPKAFDDHTTTFPRQSDFSSETVDHPSSNTLHHSSHLPPPYPIPSLTSAGHSSQLSSTPQAMIAVPRPECLAKGTEASSSFFTLLTPSPGRRILRSTGLSLPGQLPENITFPRSRSETSIEGTSSPERSKVSVNDRLRAAEEDSHGFRYYRYLIEREAIPAPAFSNHSTSTSQNVSAQCQHEYCSDGDLNSGVRDERKVSIAVPPQEYHEQLLQRKMDDMRRFKNRDIIFRRSQQYTKLSTSSISPSQISPSHDRYHKGYQANYASVASSVHSNSDHRMVSNVQELSSYHYLYEDSRFAPPVPPVYASIYGSLRAPFAGGEDGEVGESGTPGRLSRRVSMEESSVHRVPHHSHRNNEGETSPSPTRQPSALGATYKSSDNFRSKPGDLPPTLPCPGRTLFPVLPAQEVRDTTPLSTVQYDAFSHRQNAQLFDSRISQTTMNDWQSERRERSASNVGRSSAAEDYRKNMKQYLQDVQDETDAPSSTANTVTAATTIGDGKKSSVGVPPYPPPPPVTEMTTADPPTRLLHSIWSKGPHEATLPNMWKTSTNEAIVSGSSGQANAIQSVIASCKPAAGMQLVCRPNGNMDNGKTWSLKPSSELPSAGMSSSHEYRKPVRPDEKEELLRKPQAKQIMKRSLNIPIIPPSSNRSVSHNDELDPEGALSLHYHQPPGEVSRGRRRSSNKKSVASPDWNSCIEANTRLDEEEEEEQRLQHQYHRYGQPISGAKSSLATSQIVTREPNRQQYSSSSWSLQRPSSGGDKVCTASKEVYLSDPPRGFSFFSTEKETRIDFQQRSPPQKATSNKREVMNDDKSSDIVGLKTDPPRRSGGPIKHIKILKREEKHDGKMHLAAAIAGLSYDVASETYKSASGKTSTTTSKAIPQQQEGSFTSRISQRRNR